MVLVDLADARVGPISGNVFSNGPTWVQDLSIALSLGTLAPSLAGGTDFAYGGAETGSTPQNATEPEILAISLPAQLTEFQTDIPKPSATALYTLSIGANDILDILSTPSLTAAQQTTDVNDAVANEISFVNQLVADGAKNLLVLNVPDLGKTPDVTSGAANGSNTPSAALDAEASQGGTRRDIHPPAARPDRRERRDVPGHGLSHGDDQRARSCYRAILEAESQDQGDVLMNVEHAN